MPVFNPSTMNLLGWADKLTPRTGEMTVAGVKAGLSVQQTLDDMKYLRERRPLELATARIKAAHAEAEYDSFKTMNSMEMLDIKSKRIMFDEQNRTRKAKEDLQTSLTVEKFNSEAAARLPQLIQRGDTQAIADFYAEQQEALGSEYWRTDASHYSWSKVRSGMREDQQAEMEHSLRMQTGKKELERVGFYDQIEGLLQDHLNIVRDLEDDIPIESLTNVSLIDMATGGDTSKDPVKLNKGMKNFAESMAAKIESDPDLAKSHSEELKFFQYLADDFSGFSGSKRKTLRAFGRAVDSPAFTWLPWRRDEERAFKKAYTTGESLRELSSKMDSKDQKVATAAKDAFREILSNLMSYSPATARREAITERTTEMRRQIEDIRLKARSAFEMPGTTSIGRGQRTRSVPRTNDLYIGPDGKTHRRK